MNACDCASRASEEAPKREKGRDFLEAVTTSDFSPVQILRKALGHSRSSGYLSSRQIIKLPPLKRYPRIVTFASGEWRQGYFVNGMLAGPGILVSANGDRYEGNFMDGNRHGSGVFYFKSTGNRYVGEMCNGVQGGYGEFFFHHGDSYKGGFFNGALHGRGTYYYGGQNRLSLEGRWDQNKLMADASYIGHPAFLDCMLEEGRFPFGTGVLHILSDYFSRKGKYPKIAESLLSAANPRSADEIYSSLSNNQNPQSQLFFINIQSHAILLEISSINNDYFLFRIFNSGDGLERWHDEARSGHDIHYQTALNIEVLREAVNGGAIARLLGPFQSVDQLYNFIYGLRGAKKLEVQNPVLQREQKGNNCTIECVFAYLKNVLKPQAYHQMRMEFFDDCIKEIKASQNPQALLPFLSILEKKKKKRAKKNIAADEASL